MTIPNRRTTLKYCIAAASLAGFGLTTARAQSLPDSARILVGYPPGGAPDLVARRLADQLAGKLAKAVIVDNRAGASGRIAIDIARQSPADGMTLLLNPAGVLTINPHSFKKLNYDPFKDFAPISLAAMIDFGFAVGPAVPAEVKNIADFATWAKANKGKVTFGSPSAGAPPHFVGDSLSRILDLGLTHVPYRGATPALNDLLGGQISALVVTLGDLIQQAKAGRIRILATTGPTRSRFAPDLPTFTEQKVAGLEQRDWFAIYIAGAPSQEVLGRVGAAVRTALAAPEYSKALAVGGIEAAMSSADELDKLGRGDLVRWGPIVKASGFTADN